MVMIIIIPTSNIPNKQNSFELTFDIRAAFQEQHTAPCLYNIELPHYQSSLQSLEFSGNAKFAHLRADRILREKNNIKFDS